MFVLKYTLNFFIRNLSAERQAAHRQNKKGGERFYF